MLSTLWQHINISHISRGIFPSFGIFQHHKRFIFSEPYCHLEIVRQRSLGDDPSLVLVIACDAVVSSCSLPCLLSNICSSSERMILAAVQAAVQAAIDGYLTAKLASIETLIFRPFLCLLHVYTVFVMFLTWLGHC